MLVSDQVFAAIQAILVVASGPAFPLPISDMPESTDEWRLRGDGLSDVLLLSSDGEAPREIDRLQGGGGVDQIEAIVSLEIVYVVAGVEAGLATRRAAKSAALSAISTAILANQRLAGLSGYVRVIPAETDQVYQSGGSETSARLIVSILVSGPEGQI
jgi:hypothetical protein